MSNIRRAAVAVVVSSSAVLVLASYVSYKAECKKQEAEAIKNVWAMLEAARTITDRIKNGEYGQDVTSEELITDFDFETIANHLKDEMSDPS